MSHIPQVTADRSEGLIDDSFWSFEALDPFDEFQVIQYRRLQILTLTDKLCQTFSKPLEKKDLRSRGPSHEHVEDLPENDF